MTRSLLQLWNPIRVVLHEYFDYESTRNILAASGLPAVLFEEAERFNQILEACDYHFVKRSREKEEATKDKEKQVEALFSEVLKAGAQNDEERRWEPGKLEKMSARLDQVAQRLHYYVVGSTLVPIEIEITCELSDLPEPALLALRKAIDRYRSGDVDGAMSAVCAAVDGACEEIVGHEEGFLGWGFQKKANKAWQARRGAITAALGVQGEAKVRWVDACKRAISDAGDVLQMFRQQYADVHRVREAPPALVTLAFDHAIFLLRTLTAPVPESR